MPDAVAIAPPFVAAMALPHKPEAVLGPKIVAWIQLFRFFVGKKYFVPAPPTAPHKAALGGFAA